MHISFDVPKSFAIPTDMQSWRLTLTRPVWMIRQILEKELLYTALTSTMRLKFGLTSLLSLDFLTNLFAKGFNKIPSEGPDCA
jgi:hypothetical protein